jgi:bifunctional N-acetylglucosamine-1-phosphate-uridyltransferase/glucosamine-1-phosphate-acetyltransferase GlmU-like protein
MIMTSELFDTSGLDEDLQELLDVHAPWEALERLDSLLGRVSGSVQGHVHHTAVLEGDVFVAEGATVGPHAFIRGPAFLAEGSSVGHAAFLRDGVFLAAGASVGHSSEVKRALLLPHARAPHFNYVGDSIIGRNVNLGAGVKLANFNAFASSIKVNGNDTGLRKFGAAVGDDVSIGCNAVLSPGTIIGARTVIYNGAMVRGIIPADTVVKLRSVQEQAPREAQRG